MFNDHVTFADVLTNKFYGKSYLPFGSYAFEDLRQEIVLLIYKTITLILLSISVSLAGGNRKDVVY